MPLVIEPTESDKIFPCSVVNSRANLSISLRIKSLNLNKTRDLVSDGVAAHSLPALTAQLIAMDTSSLLAKLTSLIFSPFAGLYTSPNLSDLLTYSLPLIK